MRYGGFVTNPLNPSPALLCKLGSVIVHLEEFADTKHEFDRIAAKAAREDEEVEEWMAAMMGMGMLPVKR